jgi:methylated-DNA-protein-cysteine methyltransferase related protein
MPMPEIKDKNIQQRIYDVTRQIPYGKVATYGQIARIAGGCTARMVGYAMAAVKEDDIPWHRVINAQGKISPHGAGYGSAVQRLRLEEEDVEFDKLNRISFEKFGWLPK